MIFLLSIGGLFLVSIMSSSERFARLVLCMFLMSLPVVSSHANTLPKINDQVWDHKVLGPILNSNLALNGLQEHKFPEGFHKSP